MKRVVTAAARWIASFKHLSLCAVLPITAHAHWHLAVQLGVPPYLAPLLPVAVDAYVLASFRAWREQANASAASGRTRIKTVDLLWALVLDAVAVAGSHAAGQFDLATAGMAPVRAALAAALGILLVLTMWRVHALDVRVKVATRAAKPASAAVFEPPAEVVKPQVRPVATVAKADPRDVVMAVMHADIDMGMGEIVMATGLARSTAKKAVADLREAGSLTTFGDPARPRYVAATMATTEAVN